jgi:hypothetical protein
MSVVYKIGFILLIGICLSGCKPDNDALEEPTIVGVYTMYVKVNKRPPIIKYDNGRPSTIPFDHQILYGEVMDTTQNICCPDKFGSQHDCPMEYTIENVKIFKEGGQYYLQNKIDTTPSGEQISYHIPLNASGQSLIYTNSNSTISGYYSRDRVNMLSTGGFWPWIFEILYFSIDTKNKASFKGNWVLKDLADQECLGKPEMSDGKKHPCSMGEFAEFILVKTE